MLSKKSAKKTILITGAAGAVGRTLIRTLSEFRPGYRVFATDIASREAVEKAGFAQSVTYERYDIRSKGLREFFNQAKGKGSIHAVVHLASIVKPTKGMSESFIESVDVGGTGNILGLCNEFQVKQLIVTSSGAAYGYHEDNPLWISEQDPIRGNQEFVYSRNKRKIEQLLAAYSKSGQLPKILIFRPGTILGASMDNQIIDLFRKDRVIQIKGSDSPFVIVEDTMVAEAIIHGIDRAAEGAYNIAGTGAITIQEMAELLGKKVIRLPAWLLKSFLFVLKPLGLSQYGPEQIRFLQYRPVLSNDKICREFDIEIPASRSVFEKYLYLFKN